MGKKNKKGDKGRSNNEGKELAAKDERFATVLSNPIYKPVPKSEKKISIDKRFQSMFHDDKFKLRYKVDKRGRPINTTTDENLKKYYHLEGDESDESSEEEEEEEEEVKEEEPMKDVTESTSKTDAKAKLQEEDIKQESDDEKPSTSSSTKLSDVVKKKLHSNKIDYARGEGEFVSDESSDLESSSEENDEEDVEHEWGELDKDASRTEDATSRLALCNMDWDRIKAADLMVLFSSFLPAGGVLSKVSVYPSEFGKQRMQEEEVKGPLEFVKIKEEKSSDDELELGEANEDEDDEEEEEGSKYHREKLRQYQLNRLRYYYAVLEFDTTATAEHVYNECDGREYESSSAKIDLRFIPDGMQFEEEPRESCDTLPDTSKYRPKFFTTTALQQVKVDCTWDETDPMRSDLISRALDAKDKVNEEDLRAYLACSSSGSDDEEDEQQQLSNNVKDEGNQLDPISKYRKLLESIEKKKEDSKKDVELEITWGVGLKEKAEELVKKKSKEEGVKKLTPWEERLQKQKEKRRQRQRKDSFDKNGTPECVGSDSDADGANQPFSDDDVDVDMNDPFFKEEIAKLGKSERKIKKGTTSRMEDTAKTKTDDKSTDELGLLVLDGDEDKQHFNFKKIVDAETETKSKKKRKLKRKKGPGIESDVKPDNFQVDTEDPRFSALFTSHHFNVDPSDPNFKKTKGMETIISAKQKQRLKGMQGSSGSDNLHERPTEMLPEKKARAELSFLVNSIKNKTKTAFNKSKNLPRSNKRI